MFHFTVGLRDRKNSTWRALFLREGKGKAVIHYKSKLESQRRLKRLLAATSALGMMILFTGTPQIDQREVTSQSAFSAVNWAAEAPKPAPIAWDKIVQDAKSEGRLRSSDPRPLRSVLP
jgi:hypothetical protein